MAINFNGKSKIMKKTLILLLLSVSLLSAGRPDQIEQEYGGQMVSFPEMQAFVKKGANLRILDDNRPVAFVFPDGEMALTRGLLYQVRNESELKSLIRRAQEAPKRGEMQEVAFQAMENGESSAEFKRVFISFWETRDAYALLDKGFEACEIGEYEEALWLAETALGSLPEEPHHLRLLATASDGVGNSSGALIELKKALRLNPNYYGYYLQRGLLFQKLGLPEGAKTDFIESNKLYPTEEADYNLGKIALFEGHYDQAIHYFDRGQATGYHFMAQMMKSLSDRFSCQEAHKVDRKEA